MKACILVSILCIWFTPGWSQIKVFKGDFRHRPPQMVVGEDDHFSGPLKDIIEEAAAQIGYKIRWRSAPFARSLKGLQTGIVDIVPRFIRNAEREAFAHYLGPIGMQVRKTVFVTQKKQGSPITRYEDLYPLTVGVKRKTAYFSPFKDDIKITKHEVVDDEMLVRMLQRRRFEIAIVIDVPAFEEHANKLQYTDWQYTPYQHVQKQGNYFGMSKISKHAHLYPQLQQVLLDMTKSGRVTEIYKKFGVKPPVQEP